MDAVVRVHGVPRVIVSDRDTRFTSSFWKEICRSMGTSLAMSSGYHPQTNGQTERANRSIEEMLRGLCGKEAKMTGTRGWAWWEYAYNNSVHSSSGYTPFYLCYGRHPLSPVQLLSQVESKNAAADEFLRQVGGGCDSSCGATEEGSRATEEVCR